MEDLHLPHHHGEESQLPALRRELEKTDKFQIIADVFRQLGDATRVRIFWLLCHCEECVVNLAAMVGMSSPAASHHLRQLKDSGLIISRRIGKEVYYRAADTEVAGLLHQVIERTVEVTCPREEAVSHAPHLPPLDAHAGEHAAGLTPQQRSAIHQVHDLLTENLLLRNQAILSFPSVLFHCAIRFGILKTFHLSTAIWTSSHALRCGTPKTEKSQTVY